MIELFLPCSKPGNQMRRRHPRYLVHILPGGEIFYHKAEQRVLFRSLPVNDCWRPLPQKMKKFQVNTLWNCDFDITGQKPICWWNVASTLSILQTHFSQGFLVLFLMYEITSMEQLLITVYYVCLTSKLQDHFSWLCNNYDKLLSTLKRFVFLTHDMYILHLKVSVLT